MSTPCSVRATRAGLTGVLLALAATGGCAPTSTPSGSPVERAWESPPPAAAAPQAPGSTAVAPAASGDPSASPGSQPASPGDGIEPSSAVAVAIVNGEVIGQDRLLDMLLESHGVAILEQLILLTAARQRAAELSVAVTAADIAAAEEESLRRIAAPVGNPDALAMDRPAAERLLADFLRLKGISRVEWDCRMEQRAYLARIAEAEVGKMQITDQMLRDEYALAYGQRVQIRHIQASSQEAINSAAALLATASFEEAARQFSENAITREQGGLMPPFTRHDGAVPPLIRERAFSMSEGETSPPMREGTWYHIIRVERQFPASEVGFENVDPDTLRARLKERLVRQRTDELDAELFQTAQIQIRHSKLDRQFRQRHRERQARSN